MNIFYESNEYLNVLLNKQIKNHNHGGTVAELYYTNKLLITLFVP